MDAILFIHHKSMSDSVTNRHFQLFRALNPEADVIPLEFDKGRGDSEWQWGNSDVLVYEWFQKEKPKHRRFFIMEWDCLCAQSVKDFYGKAYDADAVSSQVMLPWSDERVLFAEQSQRQRDWHWFNQNTSAELHPYLRGMVPICGVMLSHAALYNMTELYFSKRAEFDKLFSECRIGTLAAMSGFEPAPIKPECSAFMAAEDVDFEGRPGIYHRVRN